MDAYMGEIRAFGFDYPPVDWAFCDGHAVDVAQFQALFSIIDFTYGGNGRTTFNLPNLKGHAAMGASYDYALAKATGTPTVALTHPQLPAHHHEALTYIGNLADAKLSASPKDNCLGRYEVAGVNKLANHYLPGSTDTDTTLAEASIGIAGEGAAHQNMQPYLALNYCICLVGEYPAPE
ncbi:phage tail protein [Ancylobacter vacuolatus]|uniref:Microcystin-dependent protein n=1 Tax=Ancylobacter vacuolatus TaxID=223389 RepID=A0ABU0DCL6_9HYPH|nr:tail fiber protein [Ancylobacter vacuolatus]MDQ0346156.1 microcystin-dependent protein [Ancylobacter vacuolatus]